MQAGLPEELLDHFEPTDLEIENPPLFSTQKTWVPDWACQNEKKLRRALGIDLNKPTDQRKGQKFAYKLKGGKDSPVRRPKARKWHLFGGDCRRAMEQRIQVVFRRLLAAPDPALAATDPLIDLDVKFAHQYYDIDIVALATPPDKLQMVSETEFKEN